MSDFLPHIRIIWEFELRDRLFSFPEEISLVKFFLFLLKSFEHVSGPTDNLPG